MVDPRWRASGQRVEFTVNVSFAKLVEEEQAATSVLLAMYDFATCLIKTVTIKSSLVSPMYALGWLPRHVFLVGLTKWMEDLHLIIFVCKNVMDSENLHIRRQNH